MKYKYLFISVLILFILSINVVVASDVNLTDDNSNVLDSNNNIELEESYLEDISTSEIESDNSQNLQSDLGNENFTEIYVGSNENDGDGSPENPFSTLMLARNKIAETNTKNAIINIYDGTYQVPRNYVSQNKPFTFDTDNLIINGLGKNVILIPDKNDNDRSFVLTTTSANFTMNNIIFNSAAGTTKAISDDNKFFKPVSGNVNAKITNCTFLGNQFTQLPRCIDFNTSYINCIFKDFTSDYLIYGSIDENSNFIYFENCIFSNLNITRVSSTVTKNKINVTFNGIWIGQNTLPTYTVDSPASWAAGTYDIFTYQRINDQDVIYTIPVKYALFLVSENYLGNNQYEIVGKLTWNGTDSSEGMENFPPMTVTLSSATGEIQSTATLTNGTFHAIYNGSSSEHKVTAKLDSEESNLTFTNVDLVLDAPNISYGDNQNITVTLPQAVSGVVTVTVNGKDYSVDVENSGSVIVPITDVLAIGAHDVNVTFVDETNHIYGFNTTTITISQVSDYDFDATILSALYIGDSATVTLVLPADADGNVSIKIGDMEANIFDVNDSIIINDFAVGTNTVNITYLGNGKYVSKSVVKSVSVSLKPTAINASDVSTNYNIAKDLIITLTDVDGKVLVNKTVIVVVGTINKNFTTDVNGQVSVDISTLTPNTYKATITFTGDDSCAGSNSSANVVVSKIASKIAAPAVSTTYNVAKNLVITLKDNNDKVLANQKVTVKVGTISKTLTTNAKGQVSVDVSKLTAKKYTATITYKGDTIYAGTSGSAKVVVNKATPKITAKKATFKAKTKTKKYAVTLKDNKGKALTKAKVTLKVKGVTYKATTNSKGKATFKITKLNKKGNYNAVIKFAGNSNFKAISKKAKLTVKK